MANANCVPQTRRQTKMQATLKYYETLVQQMQGAYKSTVQALEIALEVILREQRKQLSELYSRVEFE